MKKNPLLLAFSVVFLMAMNFAYAQQRVVKTPEMRKQQMFMQKQFYTGLEALTSPQGEPSIEFRDTELEINIGTTDYDLMTNYAICNRISEDADGNVMAVWTMGFDTPPSYPDRGTGYNRYDASTGTWGDIPDTRLEADVRTGWPNHVITDSGTEFIVSHVFTDGEYRLHTLRREAGVTDWTESDIPSITPVGSLWPRAASSGETIHVMAITTPTGGLGGEIYEGMDLHPLYYRSSDGGATWEVTDFIIPGLDSTFASDLVLADCYYMDARGDVVAIGIFSQWNDIVVFKSEDGGDTWERHTVFDFPLDNYEINAGYVFEDLPPYDTLQPDSLAIFTSDNSGQVLIDRNNMVHAFYGEMYVQDADTTDDGWTFYPGTSGLAYWNESFGEDSTSLIADLVDLNGNDTIDLVGDIASYFVSLTSMPSISVDEDNRIFCIYSAFMEGEEYVNDDDGQHYRHLFLVWSDDGGETWSEPEDLITTDIIEDELFLPFIEAIAPHQVRDVTNDLKFYYQQDFQPGWSTRGDMDDTQTNFMNFVSITIADLISSTEEVVQPDIFEMQLRPNPASETTILDFNLADNAQVSISLYNLMGQEVRSYRSTYLLAGIHQEQLKVNDLQAGVYLVRLQVGNRTAVRKLVIE